MTHMKLYLARFCRLPPAPAGSTHLGGGLLVNGTPESVSDCPGTVSEEVVFMAALLVCVMDDLIGACALWAALCACLVSSLTPCFAQ